MKGAARGHGRDVWGGLMKRSVPSGPLRWWFEESTPRTGRRGARTLGGGPSRYLATTRVGSFDEADIVISDPQDRGFNVESGYMGQCGGLRRRFV